VKTREKETKQGVKGGR